jgi:hypothetical protein
MLSKTGTDFTEVDVNLIAVGQLMNMQNTYEYFGLLEKLGFGTDYPKGCKFRR